jgi:hypothetical protein
VTSAWQVPQSIWYDFMRISLAGTSDIFPGSRMYIGITALLLSGLLR